MKKKQFYFGALISMLFAIASCGGGNEKPEQVSLETLKDEISRTSDIIEEANNISSQMKNEFHPELCEKLQECLADVEFFNGRSIEVKSDGQASYERQIDKIADCKKKIAPVINDYTAMSEFSEKADELIGKAKDAVSEFASSLSRDDFESAKAAVAALKAASAPEITTTTVRTVLKEKKVEVDQLVSELTKTVQDNELNVRITVKREPEIMLEKRTLYPCFLNRGDVLYVNISTTYPVDIKVWDTTTRKLVKSLGKRTKVDEKIPVSNSSIYVVEILPSSPLYFDITISKSTPAENWDKKYEITAKEEECEKNGFMAYPITTIEVRNLFQEPRKITLRSGFNAIFSGSTTSSASLNIPENTTDIAYQLRISTSKTEQSRDGQFCGEVTQKTKDVKLFGINVASVKKESSNIVREILNQINKPEKDEEAYASMYVLYDANSAKKFQEGAAPSTLRYDVNYSIVQTQSTNGAIPITNAKNAYLCFQNARAGANVYIWLEAVATVNVTRYYHNVYSVKEE